MRKRRMGSDSGNLSCNATPACVLRICIRLRHLLQFECWAWVEVRRLRVAGLGVLLRGALLPKHPSYLQVLGTLGTTEDFYLGYNCTLN